MKKIVFALLMGMVTVVFAQATMNVGISYQDPTQYVDNSPLPPEEIQNRTLACGTATGNYITTMVAPAGGQIAKELIFTQLALAYNTEYFCAMTVTTDNGLTSAYSAEVNFIVEDQRVPQPPVLSLF